MNRVGTLDQITYVWLAVYIWAGTGALAAAAVVVSRLVHTILARRAGTPAPLPGEPASTSASPSPVG
jgi:hypothetical protein